MRKILIFLIIAFVLFTPITPNFDLKITSLKMTHVNNEIITSKSIILSSGYKENPPIVIDGNEDFAEKAALNSWLGSGSQEHPYIISNFNITSTSNEEVLIEIGNISVYFRLEGNLLVGGSLGIYLYNVTNAALANNTIFDNELGGVSTQDSNHVVIANNTIFGANTCQGVYIYNSDNTSIFNNTIYNNADRGILVDYSSECTVSENRVFENKFNGITFRDSENNIIQNNTISHNVNVGIVLGNCRSFNITGNNITSNTFRGASIESSPHIDIVGNIFYNNTMDGIAVGDLAPAKISNNTFYRNGHYGFTIVDNVNVTYNNFIENNLILGEGQALDEGTLDDFIDNNYWDDWTAPDENEDGIVDLSYALAGGPSNYDLHPRVFAFLDNGMHILTRPLIIYPNKTDDNQLFCGEMNITWGPASDTFGHSVLYSVYYSSNDSQDWLVLTSGLTTTFFVWNTSMVPEGSNYTLKVRAECSEGLVADSLYESVFTILEHTLSVPTIIYPNGGEIINETAQITWTAVVDSWNHIVEYSVFYSIDRGESWNEITSGWTVTYYDWNTIDVPRGSNNTIKVVAICSEGLMVEDTSDGVFTLQEHLLSKPTIIYPNGGETVSETINIEWEPSVDSWGHHISYSLYYSSDNGANWNEIESNLIETIYVWNIISISNGSEYLIRVIARCSNGLTAEDESDMTFTIEKTETTPTDTTTPMFMEIAVVGFALFAVFIVILLGYRFKKQR